ncbi:uncharacterized protein ALTATR162_LOCUS782 [Alternaria atra]|uniref:Uncharacterized protein n=1 Tax=Alternaria atra TaxID=119953 RepID=A0A8J2HVS0_9PLEO|nr:uncharacterized protein ALTATR162_LOCUS782 [Alternaria atra]CAG5140763.1 unnamed protein product [Alternaria atra]
MSGFVHKANGAIARSIVGRYFRLEGSGHPKERKGSYFFTEFRAGLATFFAMAYIISVNSSIVSDSGGTCDEKEPWTWRLEGGLLPPWMKRLTSGKKNFWKADPQTEGVSEPRSEGSSAHNEKEFVTDKQA